MGLFKGLLTKSIYNNALTKDERDYIALADRIPGKIETDDFFKGLIDDDEEKEVLAQPTEGDQAQREERRAAMRRRIGQDD